MIRLPIYVVLLALNVLKLFTTVRNISRISFRVQFYGKCGHDPDCSPRDLKGFYLLSCRILQSINQSITVPDVECKIQNNMVPMM